MDWFFLHHYGKGQGYWRELTEEKLIAIMTLTQNKEADYWKNWQKILQGLK